MIAMLWHGERTEELNDLYRQYEHLFYGMSPGGCAELEGCYDSMTYDEYVGYIKECIRRKKTMPFIVLGDDVYECGDIY